MPFLLHPPRLWAFEHGGFLDAEIKGSTVTAVHSSIPSRENSQDPAFLQLIPAPNCPILPMSIQVRRIYLIVAPRRLKTDTSLRNSQFSNASGRLLVASGKQQAIRILSPLCLTMAKLFQGGVAVLQRPLCCYKRYKRVI